mmetsp:Transcript_24783/g.52809  ORF Transcript_24783/g.52809 Transcript_24783/m.52809 type:complete len:84 (+) Transcript_24783:851-1102(+)
MFLFHLASQGLRLTWAASSRRSGFRALVRRAAKQAADAPPNATCPQEGQKAPAFLAAARAPNERAPESAAEVVAKATRGRRMD